MSSTNSATPSYDIPKECKAGVVVNEGPDFHVEVQMVPVPEIGERVSDFPTYPQSAPLPDLSN